MSEPWTITVDCTDAPAQARFWAAALGYVPAPPPEGFGDWQEWARFCGITDEELDGVASIEDPEGNEFCVI